MPGYNMSSPIKAFCAALLMLFWVPGHAAPQWIEQASRPGPNLPLSGQSLFDQLFLGDDGRYYLPYPFDRLIATLESRLDNGGQPAVRQVFVPIGRSLQRDSPAPLYFRFPRRVIAVEGEPVTRAGDPGQVMEYRLFIAHQPGSETLEVISYNDGAGRFEFQVVEDYTADTSPRARQAQRVMCMSCHHNAAPIFAGSPWSETSFNVEVGKRLAAALPNRFDSLIDVLTLDAGVIDLLVERANYLSAAQLVWRRGCDSPDCRAALLRAILQYRLSGESAFDSNASSYVEDYYAELQRNWASRWPDGLALPASRIPDRDPYAVDAPAFEQDALLPRPPHATWRQVDEALARGIVYRLAGFFTVADIRRLDRQLISAADAGANRVYRHRSTCRVEAVIADGHRLICGGAGGTETLQARFDIENRAGLPASLRIVSLKIPLDPNLMQPAIVEQKRSAGSLLLIPGDAQSGLSQRLDTGDRVKSLLLRWEDSLTRGEVSLEVEISVEFEVIDRAIEQLLDEALKAGNSLGAGIFHRPSLLRELTGALGMDALAWPATPPGPRHESTGRASRLDGRLSLLEPYCGHCHGASSVNPPGFLSTADATAGILQCAPRMLARLKAWLARSDFALTPMPPPASLEYSGASAVDWPTSDHFRALVTGLENLIDANRQGAGSKPGLDVNYQQLPPCLGAVNE